MVYAITPAGDLVCLDAKNGKPVWTKNFATDFKGKMMSGWGYCESPLIDGQNLICSPGADAAAVVALNKKTGKPVWSCAVPNCGGAAYSSVVISQGGGVKQYVQLLGRGIVGAAAKDGKLLWSYNRVANGTANIPTPLVQDDYIFCSTGYNTGAALLKLEKKGSSINAREVYFLPASTLQNHHGGMVLIDDHVYCGHGHNNGFPVCVELKTGKVAWNKGRGPGSGSAAVVAADGHLYFRYENGVMALIEATPDGYNEKGTFKIPDCRDPSWPHPVVVDGKLYLREQDALLCYSLKAKP
jgi:outer membrane protein assembly factor BamB